jgi:acyl carrier protein
MHGRQRSEIIKQWRRKQVLTMTEDPIKMQVIEILNRFVEQADTADIDADVSFHEQFDFDSIDYINFVSALGSAVRVTIPEEDYYRLATLNGCVAYLTPRLTPAAETAPILKHNG